MRKLMLSAICLPFCLSGESGRSVVSFGPGEAGFELSKNGAPTYQVEYKGEIRD